MISFDKIVTPFLWPNTTKALPLFRPYGSLTEPVNQDLLDELIQKHTLVMNKLSVTNSWWLHDSITCWEFETLQWGCYSIIIWWGCFL